MGFFSGATGALVRGAANRMNEIIEANAAYDSEQKALDEVQRRTQENAKVASDLNIESAGVLENNKFKRQATRLMDAKESFVTEFGKDMTEHAFNSLIPGESAEGVRKRMKGLVKTEVIGLNGISTFKFEDKALKATNEFMKNYEADFPENKKELRQLKVMYSQKPNFYPAFFTEFKQMTDGKFISRDRLQAQDKASATGGAKLADKHKAQGGINESLAGAISRTSNFTQGKIRTKKVPDGKGGFSMSVVGTDEASRAWLGKVSTAALKINLDSNGDISYSDAVSQAIDGNGVDYPGLGDLPKFMKTYVPIAKLQAREVIKTPIANLSFKMIQAAYTNALESDRPAIAAKLREKWANPDAALKDLFSGYTKEEARNAAKKAYLRTPSLKGILTPEELNEKLAKYIEE